MQTADKAEHSRINKIPVRGVELKAEHWGRNWGQCWGATWRCGNWTAYFSFWRERKHGAKERGMMVSQAAGGGQEPVSAVTQKYGRERRRTVSAAQLMLGNHLANELRCKLEDKFRPLRNRGFADSTQNAAVHIHCLGGLSTRTIYLI